MSNFFVFRNHESVDIDDVPECLLSKWAVVNGDRILGKQDLSRIFKKTSNIRMKRIPDMFEYANIRMSRFIPSCCLGMFLENNLFRIFKLGIDLWGEGYQIYFIHYFEDIFQ